MPEAWKPKGLKAVRLRFRQTTHDVAAVPQKSIGVFNKKFNIERR
jgi:hypothetical protein